MPFFNPRRSNQSGKVFYVDWIKPELSYIFDTCFYQQILKNRKKEKQKSKDILINLCQRSKREPSVQEIKEG